MHLVLDIQDRLAGCLMVKMVRVGPGCPAHCARAGCCVRLSGWLDAPLTRAHSSPGAVCAGGPRVWGGRFGVRCLWEVGNANGTAIPG